MLEKYIYIVLIIIAQLKQNYVKKLVLKVWFAVLILLRKIPTKFSENLAFFDIGTFLIFLHQFLSPDFVACSKFVKKSVKTFM